MNLLIRHLIICILCLFPIFRIHAVSPEIESRTAVQSGHAYCFCEDSRGYIWIGMLGELVRYDGLRILKFPIPGSTATSLRPNAIVRLDEPYLLVGGDFGLKIFDTYSLTFCNSVPSGGNPVYTLLNAGGSEAFAGRAKGLMLLNNSLEADTIAVPHSVNNLSTSVYDLAMSPDSTFWITTNYGIFKARRPASGADFELKHVTGNPAMFYSRIAVSADKIFAYYSGSSNMPRGVYQYDITTGENTYLDGFNGMPVSTLLVHKDKLYVATDGAGIAVFDISTGKIAGTLTNTSENHRLLSNGIYSLYIDTRDNLYIGYYQNGVEVLSLKPQSTFTTYGDGNKFTTAAMAVRTNGLNDRYHITATRDKVMITDEQLHTTRTLGIDKFGNTQPIGIVPTGDLFALATFGGGIYMLDPATGGIQHIDDSNGLRVCDITIDRDGRLWLAATEGIFRFVDGKLDKAFTPENSCIKSGTIRIYFDRTGRGWISGQSGMAVYDPLTDRIRDDVFPEGFIGGEFVRCIAEDSRGNIFFAYDRNKLFHSDSELKKFSHIQHRLPIVNADINVMYALPDNSWIIATSGGLFSTSDFKDYIVFGSREGVPETGFSPGFAADTVHGILYLSSDKGLLSAGIDRLMVHGKAPSLVISEIRYNGERPAGVIPSLKNNTLQLDVPPRTGSTDIFFTDMASFDSRPSHIEYRLDGDTLWRSIPITRPISVHYNGERDRHIEVRPAGRQESAIEIRLHESTEISAVRIAAYIMAAVIAVLAAFLLLRRRRNKTAACDLPDEGVAEGPTAPEPIPASEETDFKEDDYAAATSKYRNFRISDEEIARLSKRLDLLMFDTKIYRRCDLKIGELAGELGVSTAVLSYYFSQILNSNYYRFLNSYRIKEFKGMVADGTYHKYTLSAMSQMCGFGSRTSFFRYFKEVEGISPLDYIKQVEEHGGECSK